jgi:polysaccharide biosynthesis protein PslF
VLERACELADTVVVMTETARQRLLAGIRVDAQTGDRDPPRRRHSPPASAPLDRLGALPPRDTDGRPRPRPPRLLTWGLLGPGKGIDWAIDAFARLDDVQRTK